MKTITLNNEQFPIEWNFYAQMVVERVQKSNPELFNTPVSSMAISIYAALMGGSPDFANDIEWVLRSLPRNVGEARAIMDAVNEEINCFVKMNDQLDGNAQGNLPAPEKSRGKKK